MRSAMWSLAITMGLNLVFVVGAYAMDATKTSGLHIVLALTNAIGAVVNAYLLFRGLRRQAVFVPSAGWQVLIARILAANLAMGASLYFLAGGTELWLELHTWARIGRLTLCVIGGAAAYFGALWLAGGRLEHFRFHAPPPTATSAPL
jgi:putative peptidoglycan lipid II flippase